MIWESWASVVSEEKCSYFHSQLCSQFWYWQCQRLQYGSISKIFFQWQCQYSLARAAAEAVIICSKRPISGFHAQSFSLFFTHWTLHCKSGRPCYKIIVLPLIQHIKFLWEYKFYTISSFIKRVQSFKRTRPLVNVYVPVF